MIAQVGGHGQFCSRPLIEAATASGLMPFASPQMQEKRNSLPLR
jgi:hypothetical protein